jgi:hypothetical protein
VNNIDPNGLQPLKNNTQGFGTSFGGTVALGSLGFTFETGVVYDGNGAKTGFLSFGPAVGADLSVEGNFLTIDKLSRSRPFKGNMLEGKGASCNIGIGPVNLSYGGNADPKALREDNSVRIPKDYQISKGGINLGSPVSGSVSVTQTKTFPMAPTFFGLLLTPNIF